MKQEEIDNNIIKLRKIVKERQEEIQKLSNFSWQTNCSFSPESDGVSKRVNIQTVNDPAILVSLFGSLIARKREWEESNIALGTKLPFKWLNYKFEEWQSDFKNRIGKLNIKRKEEDLKDLQSRLESLMSLEQKRAEELNDIAAQIEKLG